MTIGDLTKYLEDWAPPGAAWERDNVGLQVGSKAERLKNILLCLELNEEVLKEAIHKKCNFIFTHHPFIFNPLKRLDTEKNLQAQLIEKLLKNNITVYSAHTNLDFAKDGVSFELANSLKLKNIIFLENQESNQLKVVVFVPLDKAEDIASAMFSAGAGKIGEYDSCSFRLSGEGTFRGSGKSDPTVGKKEQFETVSEVRLEVLVDSWNLNKVLKAMLKVHPYEEPAYDVYSLKNKNVNYGAGAIGELDSEMIEKDFLLHVSKSLKIKNFKYCSGKNKKINKVAVCGGSGADMLGIAISRGANAFITADVKYHAYHEAKGNILFIDAGHYETEILSLSAVASKIKTFLDRKLESQIKVFKYSGTTNPVKFYKQ
ncbi:MAG: hypothetical protein FD143_2847 [Ignavibacteria bacterium]|nr:MAG: hypothetical protein FD143_2847 [Ignavibacteria bacterium]